MKSNTLAMILAGDHIYKMNYQRMIREHMETGAAVTVGAIETPLPRPRISALWL
ncbi:MAG: sugar phosphate nucleotidyltransferase [Sedimenticola sp.]